MFDLVISIAFFCLALGFMYERKNHRNILREFQKYRTQIADKRVALEQQVSHIIDERESECEMREELSKQVTQIAEELESIQIKLFSDSLSAQEKARIQRDNDFQHRINRMKEELALQQQHAQRTGTEALSFHPNVENIPHNIIDKRLEEPPDEEIAD